MYKAVLIDVKNKKIVPVEINGIEDIQNKVEIYYQTNLLSADLVELRNIINVSVLIAKSAYLRRESRGLHYTTTYPQNDNFCGKDTILQINLWSKYLYVVIYGF